MGYGKKRYTKDERKAIRLTIKLWTWLRDNPVYECSLFTTYGDYFIHSNSIHKKCWPGASTNDLFSQQAYCYLCTLYSYEGEKCSGCPLSDGNRITCLDTPRSIIIDISDWESLADFGEDLFEGEEEDNTEVELYYYDSDCFAELAQWIIDRCEAALRKEIAR